MVAFDPVRSAQYGRVSSCLDRPLPRTLRAVRGFTLIEVLVVVAIIALLVSILLPSLKRARDQAKTLSCAANLRTNGQAMAYYLEANKDVYPSSNWSSLIHKYVQKNTATTKEVKADGALDGVANTLVEFYTCPGDTLYHAGSGVAVRIGTGCKRLTYPLSYGINDSLVYKVGGTSTRPNPDALERILNGLNGEEPLVSKWTAWENVLTPACDGGQDNIMSLGMRTSGSAKRPGEVVMLTDAADDDLPVGLWDFDQTQHDTGGHALQVHHSIGNNFLYADYHVTFSKVLPNAYQHGIPPWPWAWVPLNGWKITRQTNPYNPYEQDYSQF